MGNVPAPYRRRAAAALLAAVTMGLGACGGEEADEGRPAASPSTRGAPVAGATNATTAAPGALAELPVPRTEVAGATWDATLVVAGGLTADGAASPLVHRYDATSGRWDEAPALPVPLHHAARAVGGDRLFGVGGSPHGSGQPGQPQAEVRSLGTGERQWRDEAPMPGGPRGALGAATAGPVLVATGGEAWGTALARTEIYDAERRSWRAGPDLSTPREHLAVTADGDRVYAIAGRAPGQGNFTVVESIGPARDRSWRPEPDVNDSRGGLAAAVVDGRLCVVGGEEAAGTIASVECLDHGAWARVARLARPRHGLAAMPLGGRLHVVSGGERPGLFVSGAHEALEL